MAQATRQTCTQGHIQSASRQISAFPCCLLAMLLVGCWRSEQLWCWGAPHCCWQPARWRPWGPVICSGTHVVCCVLPAMQWGATKVGEQQTPGAADSIRVTAHAVSLKKLLPVSVSTSTC